MAVSKWGEPTKTLGELEEEDLSKYLDAAEKCIAALKEVCGIDAYICYGTLLGSVREGGMIAHDDDLDLAYISNETTLERVLEENDRICAKLAEAGYAITRGSQCQFQVWRVAGSPKKVDIFTSWFGPDDQYYLFFAIAGRLSAEGLSRRTILPLRSADLNGRTFPAPREPEALLAALYGPSWSIPDPSFRYQLPADVSNFFRRAKEALRPNRSHWDGFYASSKRPQPPSQFAAMFVREVASGDQVLDLGCGDGRDTAFFCEHELRVIALDYSPSAIKIVKEIKDSRNFRIWPGICNVYDFIDIKKYSERHRGKVAHVYARFFFHALRLEGQHNALSLAHAVLTPGGRLWAEFRTPLDPRAAVGEPLGGNERVDGHYRRFIDPEDFVRDLRARGFEVEYMVSGFGMAKFRSEDPHVARVIAIKR